MYTTSHSNRSAHWLVPLVFWFSGWLGTASVVSAEGQSISVKILVDEEEARKDELWKRTLAQRVDRASVILSRYGRIRFSVREFGTWNSDNSHHDFARSLKEFEEEVKSEPAELAIGFSSQYQMTQGKSNLGGTRGPLRAHILIREGSPKVQEIERLEVLVHELAHYLGAAHSGRPDSVMRPILGDGKSRARQFEIGLDGSNAEVVRLVSTEMVDRRVRQLHQLTMPTKLRLRNLYLRLAEEAPEDPVAERYVAYLDQSIRLSRAQGTKLVPGSAGAISSPAPRRDSLPSALSPPR